MKPLVLLFGVLATISCVTANGCWKTGCNLNSWAVTGCGPFGMEERSRHPCSGGYIYECCPYGTGGGSGGNDGGDGGSGGDDGSSGGDNGSGGDHGSGGGGGSGGSDSTDVASITYEQFTRAVSSNGYPEPGREKYDIFISSAVTRGAITTKTEAAMALSQFLHESDGLRAKREYACASSQCPGSYATPSCDAPGQYYFGRGYIQLSWCYNYRPASMDLYGDDRLVHDPDMVAREEAVAWETAFWYWKTAVHSQAGVAQGQFGVTTRAINGALECYGGYQHQARARFEIYKKIRNAFEIYGEPNETGCYN